MYVCMYVCKVGTTLYGNQAVRNLNLTKQTKIIRSAFYGNRLRRCMETAPQETRNKYKSHHSYRVLHITQTSWIIKYFYWIKEFILGPPSNVFFVQLVLISWMATFVTFILTVRYELQKNFYKGLVFNKTYVRWKGLEMTETNIVDGYEISCHVYINMLTMYLNCAFALKIKLILNPLTIFRH